LNPDLLGPWKEFDRSNVIPGRLQYSAWAPQYHLQDKYRRQQTSQYASQKSIILDLRVFPGITYRAASIYLSINI
jgi:hypothetical protein